MTEDDLDAHERYITEGEIAARDDDFLARNGHRVTAVIRRSGLSAEDIIRELRRLRALVESVKALAWGGHECAGADPAAIRDYLRDLLMSEPDGIGPVQQHRVPRAANRVAGQEDRASLTVPETAPDGTPKAVVAAYPGGHYRRAPTCYHRPDGDRRAVCGECSVPYERTFVIDLYSVEVTPTSLVLVGRCAGCETVYWTIVPNPTE